MFNIVFFPIVFFILLESL